jgi:uncharacterized protein YcbK (DUF882 family)
MLQTVRIFCAALIVMMTPASAETELESTKTGLRGAAAGLQDTARSTVELSGSASCLPGDVRAMLSEVARRFGSVTIISSHRAHAVIAGSGRESYHASCRAVDFRVSDKWAAWRWIDSNWNGGAGIYANSRHSHIHIDNGPHRRWSR